MVAYIAFATLVAVTQVPEPQKDVDERELGVAACLAVRVPSHNVPMGSPLRIEVVLKCFSGVRETKNPLFGSDQKSQVRLEVFDTNRNSIGIIALPKQSEADDNLLVQTGMIVGRVFKVETGDQFTTEVVDDRRVINRLAPGSYFLQAAMKRSVFSGDSQADVAHSDAVRIEILDAHSSDSATESKEEYAVIALDRPVYGRSDKVAVSVYFVNDSARPMQIYNAFSGSLYEPRGLAIFVEQGGEKARNILRSGGKGSHILTHAGLWTHVPPQGIAGGVISFPANELPGGTSSVYGAYTDAFFSSSPFSEGNGSQSVRRWLAQLNGTPKLLTNRVSLNIK